VTRIGGRVSPVLASTALLAAVALAGCGGDDSGGSASKTLDVLAAASLTEAFTAIADDFETDHPGTEVRLAFDSSATLAEQVVQGAPADVLATADEPTMQTVVDQGGTAADPQVFATNHLQLVVPPGNPAGISRFSDIARPGVRFVLCVASAPCGKLATIVLEAAGITAAPASEEVDVKAVLSKVQLDEADAGLVYATDAVTAGNQVRAIDIPTGEENLASYPIAALAEADEPELARDWVQLVKSGRGQRVLAQDGFGKP
jgi:molybdate transport system substrate-binding protein